MIFFTSSMQPFLHAMPVDRLREQCTTDISREIYIRVQFGIYTVVSRPLSRVVNQKVRADINALL